MPSFKTGKFVRGKIVRQSFPDDPKKMGNVVLEVYKWDGEPEWVRFGFAQQTPKGNPTQVVTQLVMFEVGDFVDVAYKSERSKSSGEAWFKALFAAAPPEDADEEVEAEAEPATAVA